MNKPREYSSPIIRRLKGEITTKVSEENERRMELAIRISETLKARGLK